MSKQTINIGASPNDGTGTPLRTSFDYTNQNFTELYTALGGGVGLPGATTQVIFNDGGTNLAGDAGLVYNKTTDALTVAGLVTAGSATITGAATVGTTLGVTGVSTLTGNAFANGSATVAAGTPGAFANAALTINNRGGVSDLSLIALGYRPNGTVLNGAAYIGFITTSGSGNVLGDLIFGTRSVTTDTAPTERYRIDSTGISTWSVAGTTAMTLNSTGLGIGDPPNRNLDVRKDQSAATIARVQNQSVNAAAYSELNLAASGNNWGIRTGSTAANTNKLQFVLDPSGSNMTAATMDTTGNFLVAKTAPSGTTLGCELTATGVINGASANADNLNIYNTTASAYRFFVSAAGTVNATNATISAISDSRLKENVQDIDVGLAAILSLKPRKFDWKAGKGKDIKGDRGFIAQEFETVFPNLIDEWKDPAPEGEAPYKSVRQDLIPVLVKAIQELTAEVNALKNA